MRRFAFIASIITASVISASAGAFAASNLEQIQAYLNKGLKINLNGQELALTDSTGSKAYPITYDGTTYLPARLISEAVGYSVTFDSETNAVNIGKPSAENDPAVQPTRGQPMTAADVAGADNKKEFITLNYANLIKSYPNTSDMQATDRTFIRLNSGWYKDSTGSAFVVWPEVTRFADLDFKDKLSFSLITPNGELKPVLMQVDPDSQGKSLERLLPVKLDVSFDLPKDIKPADCKLRVYDGKDYVDLKIQ
ncbi:copper amine oxidase N-terminal domain-containing protein [Paenibacillus sp. P25]|nr:copper amine oxidase N-terminal domain-containing protein [Paenibacillus sp. P25]